MSKRLLILVNDLGYFFSHRLKIALAAEVRGYEVIVAYGDLGKATHSCPLDTSIRFLYIPIQRRGTNLFGELRSFIDVLQLFRRIKPDIVHLVTLKPYLYGSICARLLNVPCVVCAVTGLGSIFRRKDVPGKVFLNLLFLFFFFAFRHPNQNIIVQNTDDSKVLVDWGVLNPSKVRLVPGSGVDLRQFSELDEPYGLPIVCFAGRLILEKGVYDFISAARILRARGVRARFLLAGEADDKNASYLDQSDLCLLRREGLVEVLGYQDLPSLYARVHIVCLPSFYGEGIPKALIEAAAASRPIVTTDHPGCRDAIIQNVSGLLVPVKAPEKLADALEWLIEHPKERLEMGRAGRQLAEREFAIERIVELHLNIYRNLLAQVL